MLSFDNTKDAFAYKTDNELKKAHFLFLMMGKPWLMNIGFKLLPVFIKWNIPFIKSIVRSTIFQQFVGGETLEETTTVTNKLQQYNVQVILDYGVEAASDNETDLDNAATAFIKAIDHAATQNNIPFISIKITAIAHAVLLEKINDLMNVSTGNLIERYENSIKKLTNKEKEAVQNITTRLQKISAAATNKNVGILVDAEESWIQNTIDALTMWMMQNINKTKAVIYNTIQLYRKDRLQFLKDYHAMAVDNNFILSVKIVRGAYMDKERKRAAERQYSSPIEENKNNCDRNYDEAIAYCIANIDTISFIVASHNQESVLHTIHLMDEKKITVGNPNIHFSQLFGMSDNITFNLAKEKYSVSKYLPFGPIKDVVPYLMRRAQENAAVTGQTGREINLIDKEILRRNS